jgi:hypothetical protein
MKDITHLKLPPNIRLAAKLRALATRRTLTQYVTDLVTADVIEQDRGRIESAGGDGDGVKCTDSDGM